MKHIHDPHFNDAAAVYFAMLKAGFKRKWRAGPVDYARRLTAEKLSLQKHYCGVFAVWRSCGRPACRRTQSCRGDAYACLKRALGGVPNEAQRHARQAILAATPRNLGAPEQEARSCMPYELL